MIEKIEKMVGNGNINLNSKRDINKQNWLQFTNEKKLSRRRL